MGIWERGRNFSGREWEEYGEGAKTYVLCLTTTHSKSLSTSSPRSW